MKRTDLLVDIVRRETETVQDSTSQGISELTYVQCLNDAQDHLQSIIIDQHPRVFLGQSLINIVAAQEEYNLPSDIYLGTKIVSLEYKYGTEAGQYMKLMPQSLHDRKTWFSSSFPAFYIRKSDTFLLNPLPAVSSTSGLRMVYVRELRDLDVRRGVISTVTKSSLNITAINLDLTPTLSKDSSSVTNAADLLDKTDYVCIVDKDGISILDGIPVTGYNSSTGVITVPSFSTAILAAAFVDMYVVAGKAATTHSELPNVCERYLIAYAILEILKKNGNQFETAEQKQKVSSMEEDIVSLFGYPDDDIYPLPDEWGWDHGY